MNDSIDEKYDRLVNKIKDLESVIVAYSGGVDSALLMKICRMTLGKENVLALTGVSPSRTKQSIDDAKYVACENDVEHLLIDTDEFKNEHYINNEIDKCYFCKRCLNIAFRKILDEKKNFKYIVNGTNVDDYNEYRPGIKADKKHNVIYPLVEAGLNKQDIRELSKKLNLRTWNKYADTCLSTRIPVNVKITLEKLKQVEESENILIDMGFNNVRVRHLGDTARIEISPFDFSHLIQDKRQNIVKAIKDIGFVFVTLDLEGYKSGNMNKLNIVK